MRFGRGNSNRLASRRRAGDDADLLADRGKELDGCKGAFGDHYDISIGQPAMDLPSSLAGPIEQRLGRARFAVIEAFEGGEQCEEGQRHDATGPRHAHQHGGKPTQTAGFDEVPLGGAHRVAIDAAGADLGSPRRSMVSSSPDHHWLAGRHEDLDQQHQQQAACRVDDHAARLRTRWKVQKSGSRSRPGMRSAAVTVRRPGARITPASSIRIRPGGTREQIGEDCKPGHKTRRERIARAGKKTGVLHPIGRIGLLNRSNLVQLRQIESANRSILARAAPIEHIERYGKT